MTTRTTDLNASLECNGYWWADDDTSTVVAGNFKYSPAGGCVLELLGDLARLDQDNGKLITLRGLSSNNERITLLNCRVTRTHFQQGLFQIRTLICEVALVGNYHPTKDMNFGKCSVRFNNLDSWLQARYVKSDRSGLNGALDIAVRAGRQATLNCSAGKYQVHLDAEYESQSDDRSISLSAFTSLYIEPEENKDLKWFLEQSRSLRDFAGLCFAQPLPLTKINLYGGKIKITEGVTLTEFVTAYFYEQATIAPIRASYPLIMFKRLEIIAPEVLSTWYLEHKKYSEIIDLIFIVLYGHYTKPEVGFIVMMQAFEAFDRTTSPRTLATPEVFKDVFDAMVKAIPAGTSNDLRQKMKAAIQYANEPSLRKRLKDFQARLTSSVGADPFGFKNSHISSVVDTRNYFTHYADELKPKILSDSAMIKETDRFCLILILCLLDQLGIHFDQTKNGVFLHNRFKVFV